MSPVPESEDDFLSALADGGLNGEAFAQAMARLAADPQAQDTWHVYHVIGDVLRSEALAPSPADLAFCARLEARLASESPDPQPRDVSIAPAPVVHGREAANSPLWRWKWLSGSLLTVLVAVVGFGAWNKTEPHATLAQTAPAESDVQVMLRDPHLDALIAAHQQLGGYSALQMPAGFLRNATFERPAR